MKATVRSGDTHHCYSFTTVRMFGITCYLDIFLLSPVHMSDYNPDTKYIGNFLDLP